MNHFFHSGDLGDLIACLPTIRALGGGEITIGFREFAGQRESMRGTRYEAIKPLLQAQAYISTVHWSDYPISTPYDFSTFRSSYAHHESLAHAQARHLNIEISTDPWLTVDAIETGSGVVVCRSSRYHSPVFPWRKLLAKYKEAIFLGLPNEHKDFEERYGHIEYRPTDTILEMAQWIAGASLLISNQTCAWWLGAGLGVPVLQESYWKDLNSVIERSNLSYTRSIGEVNALLDTL